MLAALGAGLGPVQTGAQRAEGPVDCDPVLDLCLLDSAPWVSPQVIRYESPAGVTDLEVRLRQRADRSRADDVRVVSEDALTKTWRATLPANLKERKLVIDATTEGVVLHDRATGSVHSIVSGAKLKIQEDGKHRVAQLRFSSRGRVTVAMSAVLRASYPAEKTKRVKSWRSSDTLERPGRRKVRLRADKVEERCEKYSKCRLEAKAKLSALGYSLLKKSEKDKVPTPPERFKGSLEFVPGNASSGGGGRRYDYAVYVERGIKIDRRLSRVTSARPSGTSAAGRERDASRSGRCHPHRAPTHE